MVAFGPLMVPLNTAPLLAALLAGLWLGVSPRALGRAYLRTFWRLRLSLLTISTMLALAFASRYAGLDSTLGLAFASTGALFPFLVGALSTEGLRNLRAAGMEVRTIADLHACGLMRLMQPARWGGSDLGVDTMIEVVIELARGCTSSAWVWLNLASHSWNIGQFGLQALALSFVTAPSTLAMSAPGIRRWQRSIAKAIGPARSAMSKPSMATGRSNSSSKSIRRDTCTAIR